MFIKRAISGIIKKEGAKFPVIGIFGPRQSGKTTMAKELFKEYKYVTLEDIDVQTGAENDPRGFLKSFDGEKGVILDEVQNVPELFSYLQGVVDEKDRPGFFVLTGSQNFLLNEKVTQSLAGRIAIFTLLPLSISELQKERISINNLEELIYNGFYPRIYSKKVSHVRFYKNYIRTYLERDVRQIKNVTDLKIFQTFLKLCAGRIGQLLNLTSLSDEVGVSINTIKSWLSILEQSYIIFLLRPFHKNFGKRLVKTNKLYFCDTGLACSLLEIESEKSLNTHYLRGNLFENFIISEIYKIFFNADENPRLFFWRNKSGKEVDCLISQGEKLTPIEIKMNRTFNYKFFDNLKYFNEISKIDPKNSFVIYAGENDWKTKNGNLLNWQNLNKIFEQKK